MISRFLFWKKEVSHESIHVYIQPYLKREDTGKVSFEGMWLEVTLKHPDEVRIWESEPMEKADDSLQKPGLNIRVNVKSSQIQKWASNQRWITKQIIVAFVFGNIHFISYRSTVCWSIPILCIWICILFVSIRVWLYTYCLILKTSEKQQVLSCMNVPFSLPFVNDSVCQASRKEGCNLIVDSITVELALSVIFQVSSIVLYK